MEEVGAIDQAHQESVRATVKQMFPKVEDDAIGMTLRPTIVIGRDDWDYCRWIQGATVVLQRGHALRHVNSCPCRIVVFALFKGN